MRTFEAIVICSGAKNITDRSTRTFEPNRSPMPCSSLSEYQIMSALLCVLRRPNRLLSGRIAGSISLFRNIQNTLFRDPLCGELPPTEMADPQLANGETRFPQPSAEFPP